MQHSSTQDAIFYGEIEQDVSCQPKQTSSKDNRFLLS
jgi:hypothetical protein